MPRIAENPVHAYARSRTHLAGSLHASITYARIIEAKYSGSDSIASVRARLEELLAELESPEGRVPP
jgi:hypothetical protein